MHHSTDTHLYLDKLEQESNPLGLCTLSLGKLKLVANILHVESCATDHEPFEFYDTHSIAALSSVAKDAIKMIEGLAELTGYRLESYQAGEKPVTIKGGTR